MGMAMVEKRRYTRSDLLVEPQWVLTYYGHEKAKVLNGGWERWRAEGRAVSTDNEKPEPSRFKPAVQPKRIILFEELKERFAEPHVKLLNLLPHGYWSGADNPVG